MRSDTQVILLFLRRNKGDEAMKDLIKYLAQALVDHPEQVEVSEVEGSWISLLELKVAKRRYREDYRKAGPQCSSPADHIRRCLCQE